MRKKRNSHDLVEILGVIMGIAFIIFLLVGGFIIIKNIIEYITYLIDRILTGIGM